LIFLSFLDLLGIVLLGTVATLTFNVVTGDNSLTRLEVLLIKIAPIGLDRTSLLVYISCMAVVLLLLKTLLQALFSFRFGKFLSGIEHRVASRLYELMMKSELSLIQAHKFSDYQYALLIGSNRLTTGVIGSSVYFVSDLVTTFLMALRAIYASPTSALTAIAVFLLAYFIFNGPINRRAFLVGENARRSYLSTSEAIAESLLGLRELRVYQKEKQYIELFKVHKIDHSLTNQKTLWLNGLIRYILEISILLAGTFAAIILILTTDVKHAVTVVTVFIVIGFRLIPNIQRLQNSLNSLRVSRAATADLFKFITFFESGKPQEDMNQVQGKFEELRIENVDYSHGHFQTLTNVNLILPKNSILLILGESGAGKSTLLDLISGLISPTHGSISFEVADDLGNIQTASHVSKSYITQDSALIGDNIANNITLDISGKEINEKQLEEIISNLGLEKISTRQGAASGGYELRSDKTNISGGERQRISIARAIYFDSDLVLMDEPTSALDKENLDRVLGYIRSIKNTKTIIISTHSDELLEIADFVLELSNGKQTFFGSAEAFQKERKNHG
jgi:HlyD family secretion protein